MISIYRPVYNQKYDKVTGYTGRVIYDDCVIYAPYVPISDQVDIKIESCLPERLFLFEVE